MTQAPWQQTAPPQGGYPPPPSQGGYPPPPGPQGPVQAYGQGYPSPPNQGGYSPQGPPPPAAQQPWQQQPEQAPPSAQQSYPQQEEEGDDEFFTGGTGGKYMSFSDDRCIGAPRGGEIVGVSERQQTNSKTREPDFWPDGNKKMVKIVTVQTTERFPNDSEDTGLRSIWLPQSRDITKAVIEALRVAQDEMRLKLGGQLWVTRTGSRQTTQANGAKGLPAFTYTAQYIPPKGHDSFFAGNGAPPQGQQAPLAQNAPQGQPGPAQSAPPWQQGPPAQTANPYATGQQNGGYQQPQPGWTQPPPQGYQPSPIDPNNPFGNQPPPQQGYQPYQQ